jgi:Tol biopolymer transport system component
MLAFIRGGGPFLSDGQIYVKILPDGPPVQLTRESLPISTPMFSADGSYIAYTVTNPERVAWDTWIVPVLGGPPRLLLSNATGLSWIGDRRILFSEIKKGMHMAVVTAAEDRSNLHDVYVPAHERAMAHYSYLSPNGRWVLIVEMDHTAAWQPCRLVPIEGKSSGRTVGPQGACTAAAWSPDERWMYFAVTINGQSQLWRQRFPNGSPEQITFGPSDHQGVVVEPDGRSLITAVGIRQGAIWIRTEQGERAISSHGDASRPSFSADGNRVYYLLRPEASSTTNQLWVTDLTTEQSRPLVSGFRIRTYDVSPDETEAVLSIESPAGSELWVTRLDHSKAPERIGHSNEGSAFFGPGGEIVFGAAEDGKNYIYKTVDGRSGRKKVSGSPVSTIFSHSPDGAWVVVLVPNTGGGSTAHTVAIPVSGGAPVPICTGFCISRWSPDGRLFQIGFDPGSDASRGQTFVIPTTGEPLPLIPAEGFQTAAEVAQMLPGVRRFDTAGLTPGLNAETYAYVKTTVLRNLYRLTLP